MKHIIGGERVVGPRSWYTVATEFHLDTSSVGTTRLGFNVNVVVAT